MDQLTTRHHSFAIECRFEAAPAQVFRAWADPSVKGRWFAGPRDKWKEKIREFNFRVGGRERLVGTFTGGAVSTFDARYLDIVQDQRIVYQYDMYLDQKRISISLATVALRSSVAGTRMTFTEQAVFLDGFDDAGGRERGTRALFEQLAETLRAKVAG